MESNLFPLLFCKTLLTTRAMQGLSFDPNIYQVHILPVTMVYHVLDIGSWLGFAHLSNICPKGVSFRINGLFLIPINLMPKHKRHKFQHRKPKQIPALMHAKANQNQ